MAQSVYERERLVEVNRLLPDIRDFLRDVIKNESSISAEIIEQCDVYIERLNAIIQPPSLPPRSGRVQAVSYTEQNNEFQHAKLSEQHSKELVESKLGDVVSSEYLEQQRELSRQTLATKNPPVQQVPYNSQRRLTKSADLRHEIISSATGKALVDRQSAIYEKILSTSSHQDDEISPSEFVLTCVQSKLPEPPPVPARGGKARSTVHENIQSNENAVVMVHDLKDPLYSGLLRNVRANIKQWGVIMSQKLYLFNDLENPANFIGDLRFYEVQRDQTTKNVFHVIGSGVQSIVLAAVNDAQYQLWYNAFRRAKIVSDAAVGKFDGSGEMAEYMSAEYVSVEHDYDENDYEQPSDSVGNRVLSNQHLPSESYVTMNQPQPTHSTHSTPSTSSIVYEPMGSVEMLATEVPDSLPSLVEREDSWQSNESIPLGVDEDLEQDYTTLPLPPLPSPSSEKPPDLPERSNTGSMSISSPIGVISPGGRLHTKSEDEGSLSDNLVTGSMPSLDSLESESGLRKDRSLSYKTASASAAKLKRMRENDFLNDESVLFSGILHKRKILAVWQKHYCKVKDQNLVCYRSVDNNEASYEIKLTSYQLDRADETWRKFAFKLHNDSNVFYFAAENRADLVQWLNVLAKEMNKERFVAIKDPDLLEMGPQKSLNRQESTDESEGSQQNVNQSKRRDELNDHTSDFDADNESGESEHSDKKPSITEPLPKNFLQVSKNRRLRSREDDSPDEPDAQIQGYLFRKFQNHWTRRWCSIKAAKFFVYRHSPRDLPEAVILMEFGALTVPSDDGVARSGGWYLFKITYEGEQNIMLSTKSKDDWISWRKCIEEHIGSLSEEPFPYINVPASSTMQKNINSHFFPTDEDEADDFDAYEPVAVSSPLDGHEFSTSDLKTSAPTGQIDSSPLHRTKSELDRSYYYGYVKKIEMLANRIESVEIFVVLTKDKYLKVYADKSSTIPLNVYNALTVEFINEHGADPCILRLSVLEDRKELVLKAPNQYICEEWREKLNMIHYAEIDDNIVFQRGSAEFAYDLDQTATEKMFRKRSKSIDRQTKNEPVLISHSKTLPHMGRLKKRAKEQNNAPTKSKRFSYQRSDAGEPSKKGLSSFIRSFTVDTLGRKAKNKTFEFSNDITLKETQHGHLIEVVSTKNSVTHEQRFCRISGKVLYCYASKNDIKHVWKVSLTNATIEDNVEPDNLFKIKVTALDTGEEYNFLLNSEEELNHWVEAMYGEDKLHSSSTSPKVQRSNDMKTTPDLRRDARDILPLPPRKDTPPRIDTPPRKVSNEFSPALPARMPTAIHKKGHSAPVSHESPPVPVPKRVSSRDNTAYDCEDTPPPVKQSLHQSLSSPPVPLRLESRPSYKTKPEEDTVAVSTDRIPLSGNPNGIDKQQLTHTLSNGEGAPPLSETSPPVPRRMKNSRDNMNNEGFSISPVLVEDIQTCETTDEKKTMSPTGSTNSEILPSNDTSCSNKHNSLEMEKENISPTMEAEMDGPTKWLSAISGSLSSLSSSNTTSTLSSTVTRSTLSEAEFLSGSRSKEQKLFEDDVLLEEFMHEIRQKELSKTKLLRWLVLRKTVLEVYNSEHEKTPCKVINMENSSLVTYDKDGSSSNQLSIRLKDAEGFITEFLPQTSATYKKWISQIKSIEKSFKRNSKANTKFSNVGDIIKRRDRSVKQGKSGADNRKSLCLVEDDYKAVQKYEESTDLSRTISGGLIEYFDEEKSVEKTRHCWIKDGFFYVAKESKAQKPIKKIDLSTVVILDESDPAKHNYAFRLNYTKDNKERCIMLKAPNQNAADKWMVSVSMGILLHRLKSPQVRNSFEIEEHSDKDHEFVQLPPIISTPTYPSRGDEFELGIDIKREIAKKAEDGEEHFMNVSELLRNEFPTPNDSPLLQRKEELVEELVEPDGETQKNENIVPQTERFSQLPNADDIVFEDIEMLENIPDRENADEHFKNVRGILKQQESIRRAIIHRQQSNASQKAFVPVKKRIPPKTKPKPKLSKSSVSRPFDVMQASFVVIKDVLDDLSMTELHSYNEKLETEKTTIHNFIRDTQKKDTKTVHDLPNVGDDSAPSTVVPDSPTEVSDECRTLTQAQERLHLVTNELNRVSSLITRRVSKRFGEVGKDNGLYNSGRFKRYGSADCLLPASRFPHLTEKGYKSEPPHDDEDSASYDQFDSLYDDTNSIII